MADRDEAALRVEPLDLAGDGVAKLDRDQPLRLAAADERSTRLFHITLMFGWANSLSCRIFSARSESRRWIRVTSWLWLVM
jgi:hypothetical protein